MAQKVFHQSVGQGLGLGAALGFAAAMVYGLLFTVYGIAHTSLWILSRPANGVLPTLLANAVSVVIGSMFFAVLFGLFAAVIQAVTLALVNVLRRRFNPRQDGRTGAWIGGVTAAVVFLALMIAFRAGPEFYLQVFWRQSFWFWFALPGLVFVAMNAWMGRNGGSVVR